MRGFFTKFLFLLVLAAFAVPGCSKKKKPTIPQANECEASCKEAFDTSWAESAEEEDKDTKNEMRAEIREAKTDCMEECAEAEGGGDGDEDDEE